MKKVHPLDQVAHLFANKSQSKARNAGGTLYFEDEIIYSYGSHFPIAKHYDNDVVLITSQGYSVTTAAHISKVYMACLHLDCFNVPYPLRGSNPDNLNSYNERLNDLQLQASTARSRKGFYIEQFDRLRIEAVKFCETFKVLDFKIIEL